MSCGNKCWCHKFGILESKTAASDDGSGWGWHMMNPLCCNHWSCVFSLDGEGCTSLYRDLPILRSGNKSCVFVFHTLGGHCSEVGEGRLFLLPKKQKVQSSFKSASQPLAVLAPEALQSHNLLSHYPSNR